MAMGHVLYCHILARESSIRKTVRLIGKRSGKVGPVHSIAVPIPLGSHNLCTTERTGAGALGEDQEAILTVLASGSSKAGAMMRVLDRHDQSSGRT